MQRNSSKIGTREGYILLISILIIGAICSAIISSLLLLGINSSSVGISISQSGQALNLAQGCADYALLRLRSSLSFEGNEVLTYANGTCEILTIGGIDNTNRILCTEGQAGDSVRRLEIVVSQVLPQTKISSWQETAAFSLCR